jgi:hypothetical protein
MKRQFRYLMAISALVVSFIFSGDALALQATKSAPAKTTAKSTATAAQSDKDIEDAQAKGLVWVNTNTKVSHKSGQYYGKTKQGKFMAEAEAQKAG